MKNEHFGGFALRYEGLKTTETGCLLRNRKAKRRLRAKRNGITAKGGRKRYMCLFTSILGNDEKGCEIVGFRKAFTM